jgi:hypothetical protein
MKNNNILFLLLVICLCSNAFSMSPKQEYFRIQNNSSESLIIKVEFWHQQNGTSWEQDITGINVIVTKGIYSGTSLALNPAKLINLVSYYPNYGIAQFGGYYNKLSDINIFEKLKAIFKSLAIMDKNGKQLFSLENLNDAQIRILKLPEKGNYYYLDVHDIEAPLFEEIQ